MSTSGVSTQPQPDVGRYRWLLLLSGVAFVILGLLLIFWPGKTTLFLIQIAALFLLIEGVFDVIGAFANRDASWGWRLASGILGIIVGLIVLFKPLIGAILTIGVMYYIFGIIAICMGCVTALGGKRLADTSGVHWSWGSFLIGLIEVLLGIFFLANPVFGLTLLAWLVAAVSIIGGIGLIVFAFQIKSLLSQINAPNQI